MNVITTTLQTSNTLTITPSFDSGELLLAKLLLALLAVFILDFTFRLVYRR
jgi:hypothetical protein